MITNTNLKSIDLKINNLQIYCTILRLIGYCREKTKALLCAEKGFHF